MQDTKTEGGAQEGEDFSGIDPVLVPVAQKYGRGMFALVMNAGLAQQAFTKLAELAGKHQSRGGAHAVGIAAQAFNQVSAGLVVSQGWTEGELAQCQRDIELAWRGKLVTPGGIQLLDS